MKNKISNYCKECTHIDILKVQFKAAIRDLVAERVAMQIEHKKTLEAEANLFVRAMFQRDALLKSLEKTIPDILEKTVNIAVAKEQILEEIKNTKESLEGNNLKIEVKK